MKDRFSTTEANMAMAKLRRVSLLSDGLRQGEFYLPFRKYTCSYWTQLVGKDLLRKRATGLGIEDKRPGSAGTLVHARVHAYYGKNSLVSP